MSPVFRIFVGSALLLTACSSAAPAPSTTRATTTEPASVESTSAPTTAPSTTDPGNAGQGFTATARPLGIGDDYFEFLGNPGYDVEHYTLDLVFEPETTVLNGVATIEAEATSKLDTFNLDFAVLAIDSVLVDGTVAQFLAAAEDVVVMPQAPIAAGETFTVEVAYGGTPIATESKAIPFGIGWQTVGQQNYVVAEPDKAHTWFPSNDHPLDKATYTFRITVPDGVTAAANGNLVDQVTDLGFVTWVWEVTSPMATYLATVVIGDFVVVADAAATAESGVSSRHVLPQGTTIADWPGLDRQGEMITFLSGLFGPFPFDTYGIAVVDGFGAALENQTLSLFDRNVAQSGFFESVLIHELAHQWFGNSVSLAGWGDIWLNEGFASYAEWLWVERELGRNVMENNIAAERNQFAAAPQPPAGAPEVGNLFNQAVYRVGAMTLHALRLTVGDDAFFETLRTYAAQFADGAATTEDFIAVAESVSGAELSDLFDDWLYGTELPQLPQAGS